MILKEIIKALDYTRLQMLQTIGEEKEAWERNYNSLVGLYNLHKKPEDYRLYPTDTFKAKPISIDIQYV